MTDRRAARTRERGDIQRGLTLIELLVTIVLSGLFFAAIVPVFVLAQKTGSADRARVIALNVAQSRVERLRELPYDLLDSATLNASTAAELSGLGDLTQWEDPDGQSRPVRHWFSDEGKEYFVEYTVDLYPAGAAVDDEQYKLLTVDVWWEPPPGPVHHAVLKTAVYRQFSGSEITEMTVGPLVEDASGMDYISPDPPDHPVTVTVQLNPIDWPDTDYVLFSVYANNGAEVASQRVTKAEGGDAAAYTITWSWVWSEDEPYPGDGFYTFGAVAVTTAGEAGNSWELWYPIDQGPPGPPSWPEDGSGLRRGNGIVILHWEPPSPLAGDLLSYEVTRVNPDTSLQVWSDVAPWSTILIDRTVDNTSTYEYSLLARDFGLLPGGPTDPAVEASPPSEAIIADTEPPAPPIGLGASIDGQNVTLTWTASASPETAYYCIYKDSSEHLTPIAFFSASPGQATYEYTDYQAGWETQHDYQITAFDAALNESDFSAGQLPTVTIGSPPIDQRFPLTVQVLGEDAQVTVESLDNYSAYSWKSTGKKQQIKLVYEVAANTDQTFRDLPYGWYRIIVAFRSDPVRTITRDVELFRATAVPVEMPVVNP